LCGVAISRFGLTPKEFYQLSPLEFQLALDDFEEVHFTPMKRICEALRIVGTIVFNSTPGRKRNQVIKDPKKLIQFSWETPKVQTLEEMKSIVLGIAHMKGVKVTQKGKKVEI
jgi:hypothetical protein